MKIKRLTITVTNDNEFLPTIECGDGRGIYPIETFKSFKDAVEFVKGIDPEFVGKDEERNLYGYTKEEWEKIVEHDQYIKKAIDTINEQWEKIIENDPHAMKAIDALNEV